MTSPRPMTHSAAAVLMVGLGLAQLAAGNTVGSTGLTVGGLVGLILGLIAGVVILIIVCIIVCTVGSCRCRSRGAVATMPVSYNNVSANATSGGGNNTVIIMMAPTPGAAAPAPAGNAPAQSQAAPPPSSSGDTALSSNEQGANQLPTPRSWNHPPPSIQRSPVPPAMPHLPDKLPPSYDDVLLESKK